MCGHKYHKWGGNSHKILLNEQRSTTRAYIVSPLIPQIKIVVLGAKGVGKTSICRQFMCNEFSTTYTPTLKVQSHRPSFMMGDKIYEVSDRRMRIIYIYTIISL